MTLTPAPVLLSRDTTLGELVESNMDQGRTAALRAAIADQGYVFIRGLLPPAVVRAADTAVGEILTSAGWTTNAGEGRLRPLAAGAREAETLNGSRGVLRALLACEALHRLVHDEAILRLLATVLESRVVLRHPRPVARVVFPQQMSSVAPTPPHQDHLGMQGSIETYTAWLAIADCDQRSGAIVIAEGSHRDGLRRYHPQPGSRVFACQTDGLEGTWRSADFAPGDAVVFHSLAVHGALPNEGEGLRRSVDCRYQRPDEPICEVSVREEGDLPWELLYEGWRDTTLRRYWERFALEIEPYDPHYYLQAPR